MCTVLFGVRPLSFRVTWGTIVGKVTSPMCGTLMFMVTHPYARGCLGMHPVMIRVTFTTIVGDDRWIHHVRHPNAYGASDTPI